MNYTFNEKNIFLQKVLNFPNLRIISLVSNNDWMIAVLKSELHNEMPMARNHRVGFSYTGFQGSDQDGLHIQLSAKEQPQRKHSIAKGFQNDSNIYMQEYLVINLYYMIIALSKENTHLLYFATVKLHSLPSKTAHSKLEC